MKRPILMWSIVAVVLLLGFIYFMMNIGYEKQDVSLRESISAQQEANKAIKDKTWKVLQQKAGLLDKQENAFNTVYTNLMGERYEGEDKGQSPMFKWIKEQNPKFEMAMYMDMAAAIEANQEEFMECQKRLIDLTREHKTLLRAPVSGFFLSDKDTIEIVVVTSSKTKAMFESCEDNEVDLFK